MPTRSMRTCWHSCEAESLRGCQGTVDSVKCEVWSVKCGVWSVRPSLATHTHALTLIGRSPRVILSDKTWMSSRAKWAALRAAHESKDLRLLLSVVSFQGMSSPMPQPARPFFEKSSARRSRAQTHPPAHFYFASLRKSPLFPPDFASRRISRITMALSSALVMS